MDCEVCFENEPLLCMFFLQKRPVNVGSLLIRQTALYFPKRAQCIRNRAPYIRKRGLQFAKRQLQRARRPGVAPHFSVCVYTHTHTFTSTPTPTPTPTLTLFHTHAHTHTHTYTHVQAGVVGNTFVCLYTHPPAHPPTHPPTYPPTHKCTYTLLLSQTHRATSSPPPLSPLPSPSPFPMCPPFPPNVHTHDISPIYRHLSPKSLVTVDFLI